MAPDDGVIAAAAAIYERVLPSFPRLTDIVVIAASPGAPCSIHLHLASLGIFIVITNQ